MFSRLIDGDVRVQKYGTITEWNVIARKKVDLREFGRNMEVTLKSIIISFYRVIIAQHTVE